MGLCAAANRCECGMLTPQKRHITIFNRNCSPVHIAYTLAKLNLDTDNKDDAERGTDSHGELLSQTLNQTVGDWQAPALVGVGLHSCASL